MAIVRPTITLRVNAKTEIVELTFGLHVQISRVKNILYGLNPVGNASIGNCRFNLINAYEYQEAPYPSIWFIRCFFAQQKKVEDIINMIAKTLVSLCSVFLFMGISLFSVNVISVNVIKDPKPTVFEKELLPLMIYKIVPEELTEEEMLFMPGSLAVNETSIFIYDKAQAKIFKLDKQFNLIKTFGSKGAGPGEFSGSGRFAPVFLNIGQDKNLYAHDYTPRKILCFSLHGDYINSVTHNKFYITRLSIDKNGRKLFPLLRNGKIVIEDSGNRVIREFSIPSEYLNYLFRSPPAKLLKKSSVFLESGIDCVFTTDSKMLLFLSNFSTLVIISGNKVAGNLKLMPAGALKAYKQQLSELAAKNSNAFAPMFARIIPDQDNKDVFYLQQGSSNYDGKKGDALFAFNLKGELLKTFFIPRESGRVILQAKRDGFFYTIRSREEVLLLKEKIYD